MQNRVSVAAPPALAAAPSTQLQGFLFLALTSIVWGVNWPVVKFTLTELPPLSTRASAGLLGAALSFAIAGLRGERLLPPAREWRALVPAALLNVSSWMGLTTLGLLWLSASETTIIAYTLPIWTSLLAWPMLGERPSVRRVLGMLCGLSGVVLLVAAQPGDVAWSKLPGVGLTLAGSILFALGAVRTKRHPLRLPPVAGVAWQTFLGSAPFLLLALAIEHPSTARLDMLGIAALAYSGLLAFGLAYLTWFRALALLPASVVSIGSLMVPVVGVLSAAPILGEPLGPREIGALALTLGGVVIARK